MTRRVVVVGSINVDLVVRLPRLPRPGETVSGGTFERHHGGKGANQAVAAARLGAATSLVGLVGDDELGAEARAALAAEGIDLRALGVAAGVSTGVAGILVDSGGENVIGVAGGANTALGPRAVVSALEGFALGTGDVVLVSNEIPSAAVRAALETATKAGATAVLNPAPADGLDESILALADVVTPNRSELGALAGDRDSAEPDEAAAKILAGPDRPGVRRAVVVTLGAAGALVVVPRSRRSATRAVPAPAVDSVDATGAGDAFNGCLAASLAAGLGIDLAVERAVVAGALATRAVGARSAMPTTAELEPAVAAARARAVTKRP